MSSESNLRTRAFWLGVGATLVATLAVGMWKDGNYVLAVFQVVIVAFAVWAVHS